MNKKICVVTGSRAEFGILSRLIHEIDSDDYLNLQLIATGMHLSPEFGLTYKEIEAHGLRIDKKIEILLSSDTSVSISKSMGLAQISFAEAFEELKPDIIILLGDRFEIFSAASAALVAQIPIAHIHGGETTEGAFDESLRHSITKMSHLHFTSTETYKNRIIQLGENPNHVFNVGSLGVENIKHTNMLKKQDLEKELNFLFKDKNLLVTFHPVTLEKNSIHEFQQLLNALNNLNNTQIIFTKSNADNYGRKINKMIDEFVNSHPSSFASYSLGQKNYYSCLQYVDAVVGNSSSGILEAPSFNIATINIGDRQKGRVQSKSIVNCKANENDLLDSIRKIYTPDFQNILKNSKNPYEKNNTCKDIIAQIKKLVGSVEIKKHFFDFKYKKRITT